MGLFGLFKKKKSIFGENLDKLAPDGDLPFGWYSTNKDFIENAKAEYNFFADQYFESRKAGDPKQKYAALKSLLLYIEDAQKKYAKMGECFLFWFVEICVGIEDIVPQWKEELEYLETNMDELMKKYKMDQYIKNVLIPEIKEKAISIIKDNPGILQTDMYSHFEERSKGIVQTALYQLNVDGKIKREKHGRTYKLSI